MSPIAFSAGEIKATLTLDRSPFTAGLRLARKQARDFANERYEATVKVVVDQTSLRMARTALRALGNMRARARATVDVQRAAFDKLVTDLNRFAASTFTAKAGVDVDDAAFRALQERLRIFGASSTTHRVNISTSGSGGAGTALAIAALLPLLASVTVAATGLGGALVSAFGVAGIAAGAFALVAVPAFTRVKDAVAAGQEEINKLPEGLRQAATAMQGLNTQYEALVLRTQGGVGFAMAAGFDAATAAVRTLDPIINAASVTFASIGRQIEQYFGTAHWQRFVDFIAGNLGPTFQSLFEIMAYATRGVMNLIVAFQPLADWLLPKISEGMQNFATWAAQLGNDPKFLNFLNLAKESLSSLSGFLGSTVALLWNLSIALAPVGNAIMDVLSAVFNGLSKLPPEWLNAIALGLGAIFIAMRFGAGAPIVAAIGAVALLAAGFTTLYRESEPFRQMIDRISTDMRERFLPVFQDLATQFQEKVLPAVRDLGAFFEERFLPAFERFYFAAAPILEWLISTVGSLVVNAFARMIQGVEGALQILTGILDVATSLITGDWDLFWQGLGNIAEGALNIILASFGIKLDEFYATMDEWGRNIQNVWASNWGGMITEQDGSQRRVQGSWNDFWNEMDRVSDDVNRRLLNTWVDNWGGIRTEQDGSQRRVNGSWNDFWNEMDRISQDVNRRLYNGWVGFWGGTKTEQNGSQSQVRGAWFQFWDQMGRRFNDWWNGTLGAWNTFWGNFGRVTNDAVSRIGSEFRRIANLFRDPINWVINVVMNDGILKGWNTVMGWIGAPGLRVGRVPNLPFFAEGGKITGGIANKDSVPIMTMPGEYVLSKRAIANMGGLSQVDQMHRAARMGALDGLGQNRSDGLARQALMRTVPYMDDGNLRAYAYGGVQPHVARAGQEIERLFGRMPGGIGGVGNRGNKSDHPSGHALDFMTMRDSGLGSRIASHFIANAQRMMMKYIIWQQRINSGSGWRGMEDRGSATANHMDHPHVSFLRAGQGGKGFSGGGDAPQQSSWWDILGGRVSDLFKGLLNFSGMPGSGSPIGQAATQIPTKMVGKVVDAARAKLSSIFTGMGEDIGTSFNVARWTPQVLAALMRVGQPPWLLGSVNRRMRQESGGNPRALNLWDSNAKKGTPSKGLMQVIDPTFRAYRDKGLPNDIWDPMANITASMNYAMARYGSLSSAYDRAGGYATGGILNPGQIGYNETGLPERVLNPRQTQLFERMILALENNANGNDTAGVGSGGGYTVNNYLTTTPGMSTTDLAREIGFQVRHARQLGGVHN